MGNIIQQQEKVLLNFQLKFIINNVALCDKKLKAMKTHHWYNLVSSDRNDIVFSGRNKAYGAYQLRMNYNKTLSNILLSMIGVAILAAVINYVINQFSPEEERTVTKIYDVIITPNITKNNSIKPSKVESSSGSSNPKLSPIIAFSPTNIKDSIDDNKKNPINISNTGTGTEDTTGTGIEGNTGGNGTGTNNNVYGLDSVTEATKPFLIVTEMPEFPGGQEEMIKFIQSRMNYPVRAIEAHISGVCYIRFVVNSDGHITNVEVIKSVPDCPECDEEAKRVVESMPLWKPGRQNGKPVPVYMQIPVRFKIK